jgi:hypothetical protein
MSQHRSSQFCVIYRRKKNRATYVSEKDFMVFLCRLETAILAASCTSQMNGGKSGDDDQAQQQGMEWIGVVGVERREGVTEA